MDSIIFEVGKKYTTLYIDECMAMTHKDEITVTEIEGVKVIFKGRGKRKKYIKRMEWKSYQNGPTKIYTAAVFEGWDQPYTCDTDGDTGLMRGNACYNFVGPVDKIREWLSSQINPNFTKESALAVENDIETVVFPEDVKEGNHAVIDRIIANSNQA